MLMSTDGPCPCPCRASLCFNVLDVLLVLRMVLRRVLVGNLMVLNGYLGMGTEGGTMVENGGAKNGPKWGTYGCL